jgi:hypothetical protein
VVLFRSCRYTLHIVNKTSKNELNRFRIWQRFTDMPNWLTYILVINLVRLAGWKLISSLEDSVGMCHLKILSPPANLV